MKNTYPYNEDKRGEFPDHGHIFKNSVENETFLIEFDTEILKNIGLSEDQILSLPKAIVRFGQVKK